MTRPRRWQPSSSAAWLLRLGLYVRLLAVPQTSLLFRQARLVGAVRQYIPNHGDLTWDDVSSLIIQHLKTELEGLKWSSTCHVHHRVAAAFQKQRIFLLGDAAHIHSPFGGQGMTLRCRRTVSVSAVLRRAKRDASPTLRLS